MSLRYHVQLDVRGKGYVSVAAFMSIGDAHQYAMREASDSESYEKTGIRLLDQKTSETWEGLRDLLELQDVWRSNVAASDAQLEEDYEPLRPVT